MNVDREELSALVVSAGLIFVGALMRSFSKLIERVIVGRSLSPSVYGEVSIGLAILSFAVTASLIGFNQGIPRYVSRFDDERDVRGIWIVGLAIAGALSVVLAVLVAFNVEFITGKFFETAASDRLLVVFVATIPFVAGLRVSIGVIRGLENTVYKTFVNDLLYPGLRIAVLVGLLSYGLGLLAPAYAYLLAAAVAFVAAHLFLNRLVRLAGAVQTHTRELVTFSVPLVISTVVSILLTHTDTLMVGYFKPSRQVGLYAAAYPIAYGLLVVLSSFGYLYLPLASRLDAEDKHEEISEIYQLSSKWIYILTFPPFLAVVAFPQDVMRIVFSAEYRTGGTALLILSVGFFTNAMVGRNRETLSALGYPRGVLISNVVAFGGNFLLNLWLIPAYGFVGAAAASAASYILLNVVVYGMLRRKYGITPFTPYTVRTFVVLPAALILPAEVLSRWVSLDLASLVAFLLCSSAVTVVVVSVTGCLQPEDKIPLELVEDRFGITVPMVHRFVPE
ncbi:MAG: flippase [Halosimplex sp.]